MQVTDHAELALGEHFRDLLWVNIEMHEAPGLWGKAPGIARNPIVVARAQRHHEVSMVHQPVADVETVHAEHAVVTGMGGREGGLAWQRMHHRARGDLEQLLQCRLGLGQHDTVPGNDYRAFSLAQARHHGIEGGIREGRGRRDGGDHGARDRKIVRAAPGPAARPWSDR